MLKYTLLLLHGWSQNPNYFTLIKPSLENKYKIFSPIMPGFGETKINFPYNLDKDADWLKEFIIKNKITNPILLGHSFGGSVCVKFLSKYPNQKIKLILVDAAIVKDKYSIRKSIFYFLIHLLKSNINSPVMEKTFQNVVYSDLIKEAIKLKNETLIIWGDRDVITPLTFGKEINKNMKDSTLKIIPNSGHFPFIDKPSLFVSYLNKFIITQ